MWCWSPTMKPDKQVTDVIDKYDEQVDHCKFYLSVGSLPKPESVTAVLLGGTMPLPSDTWRMISRCPCTITTEDRGGDRRTAGVVDTAADEARPIQVT